jgi:hypothetical protein
MSLNITAFSRARFVHNDEACKEDDHHTIWSMPEFVDRLDGKEIGCYVSDGKEMAFAAGSYSGYNRWREILSFVALDVVPEVVWENVDEYAGKPFVELINMADNEGAIGPVTSRKLAMNFEGLRGSVEYKLQEVVEKRGLHRWFDEEGKWWLKKYDEWHKAFVLASDGGFVDFR